MKARWSSGLSLGSKRTVEHECAGNETSSRMRATFAVIPSVVCGNCQTKGRNLLCGIVIIHLLLWKTFRGISYFVYRIIINAIAVAKIKIATLSKYFPILFAAIFISSSSSMKEKYSKPRLARQDYRGIFGHGRERSKKVRQACNQEGVS